MYHQLDTKPELPESASSHKEVNVLVGLMESALPEGMLTEFAGNPDDTELPLWESDVTPLVSVLAPIFVLLI